MKIVRYIEGSTPSYGILEGETVYSTAGDPFKGLTKQEPVANIDQLPLLTPVDPRVVVAIGQNYMRHVKELDPNRAPPAQPRIFVKPVSSLLPHNGVIELPRGERIDHEAELGVVMSRTARNVSRTEALDYVLGYTCGNDVSHRDNQAIDGPLLTAKGYDTFGPLGPAIETELSPHDLRIQARVNGEVRQESNTSDLIFDVPYLIEYITRVATLGPGDVVMTGTPEGVGPITDGDTVEIEIEGIGILRNTVRQRAD